MQVFPFFCVVIVTNIMRVSSVLHSTCLTSLTKERERVTNRQRDTSYDKKCRDTASSWNGLDWRNSSSTTISSGRARQIKLGKRQRLDLTTGSNFHSLSSSFSRSRKEKIADKVSRDDERTRVYKDNIERRFFLGVKEERDLCSKSVLCCIRLKNTYCTNRKRKDMAEV